jgi:hypothetical protein
MECDNLQEVEQGPKTFALTAENACRHQKAELTTLARQMRENAPALRTHVLTSSAEEDV